VASKILIDDLTPRSVSTQTENEGLEMLVCEDTDPGKNQ
jgi:hypothetical protein